MKYNKFILFILIEFPRKQETYHNLSRCLHLQSKYNTHTINCGSEWLKESLDESNNEIVLASVFQIDRTNGSCMQWEGNWWKNIDSWDYHGQEVPRLAGLNWQAKDPKVKDLSFILKTNRLGTQQKPMFQFNPKGKKKSLRSYFKVWEGLAFTPFRPSMIENKLSVFQFKCLCDPQISLWTLSKCPSKCQGTPWTSQADMKNESSIVYDFLLNWA